uniref:Transcription initiation factor TFIID subunit 10 n=1 Tax=Calcidiscus leptoporus TaxID=127549 RepID=A0A7S0NZF6_9EUKA|mmetsp:Transcript_42871/g.100463  ORF Transcript_42871/g.100463 Transcript_42871/m.100463 type:complete len:139 (+) Transcript_42871:46-462(+)
MEEASLGATAAEREVAENLLLAMEDYSPTIPDEVTKHFLRLSGYESTDDHITRLVSLAAHKFVADLTSDAMKHCEERKEQQSRAQSKGKGDVRRLVLTTNDLARSSSEFGISIRKPVYYADYPATSDRGSGEGASTER